MKIERTSQIKIPCNTPNKARKSINWLWVHLFFLLEIWSLCPSKLAPVSFQSCQNMHNVIVLHICFSLLDTLWESHSTNKLLIVCGSPRNAIDALRINPSIFLILWNGEKDDSLFPDFLHKASIYLHNLNLFFSKLSWVKQASQVGIQPKRATFIGAFVFQFIFYARLTTSWLDFLISML